MEKFQPSEELKTKILKESYIAFGHSTFYLNVNSGSNIDEEIERWAKSYSKISIGGLIEVSPDGFYKENDEKMYGFSARYYLPDSVKNSFKNITHKMIMVAIGPQPKL